MTLNNCFKNGKIKVAILATFILPFTKFGCRANLGGWANVY